MNSARATAPQVIRTTVFSERGEFISVNVDDARSPAGSVTLAGTSTQGVFRFYLVNVDSMSEVNWSHAWGNGDICHALTRTPDSSNVLVGRTSQNETIDFRIMRADFDGSLHGNDEFGSDSTHDRGYDVIHAAPDAYIITGRVEAVGDTVSDLVLAKTDEAVSATETWIFEPGAAGYALLTDGDSILWTYGYSDEIEGRGTDFLCLRSSLDTLGRDVSYWTFGGSEDDICRDAVRISPDLTIMVGETHSFSSDPEQTDIWVLAINDNGDSLWSRTWGGSGDDAALAVERVPDTDEGVVIAGFRSDTSGVHHALLMKIGQSGDSLWSILLEDTVRTEFAAVTYDSGFHYHAAGVRQSAGEFGLYMVTEPDPASPQQHPPSPFSLLTPADGDTVFDDAIQFTWEAAEDPDGDNVVYALLLDSDTLFEEPLAFGPLFEPSFTWDSDTDDVVINWRVVASDAQNNSRICRERHRSFLRVIPDSTQPFSLIFPDSGAVLPQPMSEFRWERAIDPDLQDEVLYDLVFEVHDTSLVIEGLVNTFLNVSFADNPIILQSDTVVWYVRASSLLPEMVIESREHWIFVNWNVSADPLVGVIHEFGLSAAFPNPFNAQTTIPYSVDRMTDVRLDIFDIQGRLVRTIVSGNRLPGSYTARWNGRSESGAAASGIYFVRLSAGSRTETAKLIYMK